MAKAETKRPGVRRPSGEQLEAMTIRLTPKLKFGLELLSRLQSRSLSQAIEWALQHALVSTKVTSASSVWNILSFVWEFEGWARTVLLYQYDPLLVTFEERHAARLLCESPEQKYVLSRSERKDDDEVGTKWSAIVEAVWPRLLSDSGVMEISSAQEMRKQEPLCLSLGLVNVVDAELPLDQLILLVHKHLLTNIAQREMIGRVTAGFTAIQSGIQDLGKGLSPKVAKRS